MKTKKDNPDIPDMEEMESELHEGNQTTKASTLEESGIDIDSEDQVSSEEMKLEDRVAALEISLEEMTAKADEYLDGWQRARAEFANYKKRVMRENTDIRQVARGEVIKLFLDIADDLERALQDKPENGDGESWAGGINIIFQKLRTRLEAEGIKPMNPLGEEFDPNIHEALMKEESDEYKSGQIIEVMQEGYWIGEKVLRPALVRVAA